MTVLLKVMKIATLMQHYLLTNVPLIVRLHSVGMVLYKIRMVIQDLPKIVMILVPRQHVQTCANL